MCKALGQSQIKQVRVPVLKELTYMLVWVEPRRQDKLKSTVHKRGQGTRKEGTETEFLGEGKCWHMKGKSIPGRGNSRCKGPEASWYLVCSRISKARWLKQSEE